MLEPGFGQVGSLVLQKKSLKDEVFDLLHQRIVAGSYAPGEWLRQEEIASQLGVSQTPVREALDQLVSVGLAERVPYRGARVPEWSAQEIVDAYVARLILESAAARMAALNISSEQLRSLQEIVKQTEMLTRLEDMPNHRWLNKRFHLLIAEASGNLLLSRLYEMTSNQFPDWRLYEYMFRHPELLETSLRREYGEHEAMVEAIASGNPERAAAETVNHIRRLREELVAHLDVPKELLGEKEKQLEGLYWRNL
jgi:DNA-binding GntR family transcriptional regulator